MHTPNSWRHIHKNGWILLYINYMPIELVDKCTNCLQNWGKIHDYNSLRRVYSHTRFQIVLFLWQSQSYFKLSHQRTQPKRVVLHYRDCRTGEATVSSCHWSVRFMDQNMRSFLQYNKDERSKWNFMKVLFLSCSLKTIFSQISGGAEPHMPQRDKAISSPALF